MFTLVASKLNCGYLEPKMLKQNQWLDNSEKNMHTHHFGLLSRTREYLRRRVTRKFGDGIVGFLCLRGRILGDFAQLRKLMVSQYSEWQMILVRIDKIPLTAHLCK